MKILKGIKVSSGIAIGRAFVIDDVQVPRIPKRSVRPERVQSELDRFERARLDAIAELDQVHNEALVDMGQDSAKVFLFHRGMLEDPALLGPIRAMIRDERVSPEYAAAQTFRTWMKRFAEKDDSAFRTKINDLHDISHRLIGCLIGKRLTTSEELPDDNTIIVASELTPSQTVAFDRSRIIGMVTELGGQTSHTAIVARALGLPAVVGCANLRSLVSDGMPLIIDGARGRVIIEPDDETIEQYQGYIKQSREFDRSLEELAPKSATTSDGVEIELLGNIEFPEEASTVVERGGAGIGLYRTEFLYLTGDHEPSEDEQFEAYKTCIDHLAGRPLTIRTLDLGADKYTQLRAETPERNPFLGLRSIRYCLAHLPMFRTQLRALLRASAYGPLKIMLPLVTTIHEFRQTRYLIRDAMEDLDDLGLPYDRNVRVGIMVEVPSAVLLADVFAREVDFFSIGTNDLVQYALAVDRTNERVASMYQPAHPAVLRLIRMVVKSARRKSLPVSCCGEAASDLEYVPLLLGLGVRTLSVNASSIPVVKRLIRSVSMAQCERIAKKAITFDSELESAAFLRTRVRKIVPEAFEGRAGEE